MPSILFRRLTLRLAGAIAMACAALVSSLPIAADSDKIDWRTTYELLAYDWTHLAGAELTEAGVLIEGLGRGIVPPSDAADDPVVPNPPINLRGPVVHAKGDFSLDALLKFKGDAGGYVTFYGDLPLNQDEWRQEGKSVTLGVFKQRLIVEIQNGIGDYQRHEYPIANMKQVGLGMARVRGRLAILADGQRMANLPDPGIFSSGKIIFGAHAEVDHSFILASLVASPITPGSRLDVVDTELPFVEPDPAALRRLSERYYPHLHIGTAVSTIPLLSDAQYARVLAQNYNMVTPENAMKFQFIHPQPDRYAFADADAIVDFAERNDMAVHGHTLVWGEALPRWVTEAAFTDAQIQRLLADHIATVVGRYKGRVASWDVINEPLQPFAPTLRTDSPWYRAMGEDYIEFALREAHRADPAALLYINEFACEERNAKSDGLYRLARRLLERGVPLHGIGFQLHEDLTDEHKPISAEAFRENVQRFIELGLEVRISEMDVNLHQHDSPERLQAQARYYRSMLELAADLPAFSGFSTWGFTDHYSSLQAWWEPEGFGNGLPFDAKIMPKPAYDALRQALVRRH
ncbi:endo-1,4-beta-xylanase [Modicisalibacter luteus]|uniref:Beta-xylanase n=1 Tax=Modicisalibacter luteus TaxID=453962 RepID=A0ABV7M0V4_9GAMM|nr:endo-1,4-beta-xylanase [Halomonas lutea]GHA91380.1 beta-xylanase [Halomonas lutea]